MKTLDDAKKLAELLKYTGESFGQKVSVIFTRMDSPLGFAIGNALEIKESIEYLKGANIPDIDQITKALAIEMLIMTDIASDKIDALKMINEVITNGKALEKFKELIEIQGGDPLVCEDTDLLPKAQHVLQIISDRNGFISAIDSQKIGYALIKIGAGRMNLQSPLDMGAGAYFYRKIGDKIDVGEIIGEVLTNDDSIGKVVIDDILKAVEIVVENTQMAEQSYIIHKVGV
jgi:pyrimidine-nucleoside phosphorylase